MNTIKSVRFNLQVVRKQMENTTVVPALEILNRKQCALEGQLRELLAAQ